MVTLALLFWFLCGVIGCRLIADNPNGLPPVYRPHLPTELFRRRDVLIGMSTLGGFAMLGLGYLMWRNRDRDWDEVPYDPQ